MAARINLLDWRADRRKLREQQFIAMVAGCALLAAAGVVGTLFLIGDAIEYQQQRNAFLTEQIREMDRRIKEIEELERVRANLLARMKVIEELQGSRTAMVHFFDEVLNTLPDGVYIKSLVQSGTQVTVDGVAESTGRVSAYMKNIESSRWFTEPRLAVIRTVEANRRRQSEFQLVFKNLTQSKPQAQDGSEEALE
jgi:type IV pilus assembly protein PilN